MSPPPSPYRLRRKAYVLGTLPLVVGAAAYVAWRLTRDDLFVALGLCALAGGAVAVAAGAGFLVAHVVGLGGRAVAWGAAIRGVLAPAAFLVLVTAVGLGLAGSALRLMETFVVEVRNESDVPIDRIEVAGGGGAGHVWTDLAPGAQASATLRIQRDGVLEYRATVGDAQHDGVAEGYVTPGLSGKALVRYRADGTFSRGGGLGLR